MLLGVFRRRPCPPAVPLAWTDILDAIATGGRLRPVSASVRSVRSDGFTPDPARVLMEVISHRSDQERGRRIITSSRPGSRSLSQRAGSRQSTPEWDTSPRTARRAVVRNRVGSSPNGTQSSTEVKPHHGGSGVIASGSGVPEACAGAHVQSMAVGRTSR